MRIGIEKIKKRCYYIKNKGQGNKTVNKVLFPCIFYIKEM